MTVVKSINDITGTLCVDIISNGEGQFSYKCFRRDPEDNSGGILMEQKVIFYTVLAKRLKKQLIKLYHG